MNNGDKIREMNNEELAHLIYSMIVTNKKCSLFEKGDYSESEEEYTKGVRLLIDLFNEEVDY